MSTPNQLEKLRNIYQLLFDLATGRRTLDLDLTTADDEYDTILLSLFHHGKRIRELVLEQGIVPPHFTYQHLTRYVFVLDSNYRILDFNYALLKRLKYQSEVIPTLFFEQLLDESSKLVWNALLEQLDSETQFFVTAELLFLTADGFKLPLYCSISKGLSNQFVYVVSIDFFLNDAFFLKAIPSVVTEKNKAEVAIIAKVHQYILDHLDAPLPSLKSLALLFGSEEHKIRNGFREHYQTSVYQFYQDERLKKAYLLIMKTDMPLKEIAYACGFEMYLNFYKAFRKKYGFSPSELSRE